MKLKLAISTAADGNMAVRQDLSNQSEVTQNRSVFLNSHGIDPADATRVKIVYQGDNYCRYHEINRTNKGGGMFGSDVVTADGLVTRQVGQALFLPLADCVGMVIFDPNQQILMLSHVGRHSLEQNGAYQSVMFMVDDYHCQPADLLIWLTPAPSQTSYPLFAFDNRGFKEVIFEQLKSAAIRAEQITDDSTDTTQDYRYFSHSEFLKGNRPDDGRYAIVAVMSV